MNLVFRAAAVLLVCIACTQAQRRVDPTQLYERVFVIAPMIGKGTPADPKRPAFAPVPDQLKPGDRSGVIAMNSQVSDDGKFALVEIVMANKLTAGPVMRKGFARGGR